MHFYGLLDIQQYDKTLTKWHLESDSIYETWFCYGWFNNTNCTLTQSLTRFFIPLWGNTDMKAKQTRSDNGIRPCDGICWGTSDKVWVDNNCHECYTKSPPTVDQWWMPLFIHLHNRCVDICGRSFWLYVIELSKSYLHISCTGSYYFTYTTET